MNCNTSQLLSVQRGARFAKFSAEPKSATQLVTVGASPAAASVNPGELAAYTLTANVLLNLNEVVTRE